MFAAPVSADDSTTSLVHAALSELLAHRVKHHKPRAGVFVHAMVIAKHRQRDPSDLMTPDGKMRVLTSDVSEFD